MSQSENFRYRLAEIRAELKSSFQADSERTLISVNSMEESLLQNLKGKGVEKGVEKVLKK